MSFSTSTIYLAFRICEFVLGAVCFGLFANYYLYLDTTNDKQHLYTIKYGICFTAADAFPFLVQIPFLIAYSRHGHGFAYNILNPIVNLIGGVVYLTSGSLGLNFVLTKKYNTTAFALYYALFRETSTDFEIHQKAVGSMFVATGAVYILDLICWIVMFRQGDE